MPNLNFIIPTDSQQDETRVTAREQPKESARAPDDVANKSNSHRHRPAAVAAAASGDVAQCRSNTRPPVIVVEVFVVVESQR